MSKVDERILISRAYNDMPNFYIEGLLVHTAPGEPEMILDDFVKEFRNKYIPEDDGNRSVQLDLVSNKLDTIERLFELIHEEVRDLEGILYNLKESYAK